MQHIPSVGAQTPVVVDAETRDKRDLAELSVRALPHDVQDARELIDRLWAPPGEQRVRLVVREGDHPIGYATGTLQGEHAHLDLIAVDPARRHRGIGTALLAEWESRAAAAGAYLLHAGGSTRTYAWPGIDMRYTSAVTLFLRAGYRREAVYFDMDVTLDPDSPSDHRSDARLADAGVSVRRASAADAEALRAFISGRWDAAWAREAATALDRSSPSVHVAERDGELLGFGAHGVHRTTLYGPIGVDESARGLGVGDALSRALLADMAAGGVTTARISWVAESAIPFYSRTLGAHLSRCYWSMIRDARPGRDAQP